MFDDRGAQVFGAAYVVMGRDPRMGRGWVERPGGGADSQPPSGQPAPRALDLLAPQELQIARLAAEGLSNREIGQQLYLSHRTVRNHLYRIFPKLGITSRTELAAAVGISPGPV